VIIEMMTLALADCSPKYSFEVFAPCMNLQDDLEPISFYNPHYPIEMLAWAWHSGKQRNRVIMVLHGLFILIFTQWNHPFGLQTGFCMNT